jgi:arylsulfatase A-like enzyme
MFAAKAVLPATASFAASSVEKPNIIVIIADQRHYGLSKATGYPLDTSPTLDRMQKSGVGFERNYCTAPVCVPSRTSMLTGRWPEATHVRMNLQLDGATYESHLYQVAHKQGYRTALVGKNHTFLKSSDVDFWREYSHNGGYIAPNAPKELAEFDAWLKNLNFNVAEEPAPFPLHTQLPYRIVSDAIEFVDQNAKENGGQPFLMQVSIPEPHDPEQVPAPYWDMFPPDSVPDRCAGPEALATLGPRARWEYQTQQQFFPATDNDWRRYKSNYLGALRMVDDQIGRLVEHLDRAGQSAKTVVVFTSDHGDYIMDFGLARKGVGLPEDLVHTPFIWWGYGVRPSQSLGGVFSSVADLMPTLCEVMGADIPHGVQGRSLWPLLQGQDFPAEEFRSMYAGNGVGGLYYDESDHIPASIVQTAALPRMFDELNMVTQSGNQKMVRMAEWKLIYDAMGYGQLYNLREDPCELRNLFNRGETATIQSQLMAELAMWLIRTQDALPTGPQNQKYQTKWPAAHNWLAPYRQGKTQPAPYIP